MRLSTATPTNPKNSARESRPKALPGCGPSHEAVLLSVERNRRTRFCRSEGVGTARPWSESIKSVSLTVIPKRFMSIAACHGSRLTSAEATRLDSCVVRRLFLWPVDGAVAVGEADAAADEEEEEDPVPVPVPVPVAVAAAVAAATIEIGEDSRRLKVLLRPSWGVVKGDAGGTHDLKPPEAPPTSNNRISNCRSTIDLVDQHQESSLSSSGALGSSVKKCERLPEQCRFAIDLSKDQESQCWNSSILQL